ncbi:uncharacterized protein LOC116602269 [Nematostella vectensis]|uniref:uncharacterized protein LOC116602269 n=1 Tax=Nematostella vectensis TaxID=45351 RepID=UPI00207757C5|nr:uncharacterized protein LOC116602269 [Nematostella vectensis]
METVRNQLKHENGEQKERISVLTPPLVDESNTLCISYEMGKFKSLDIQDENKGEGKGKIRTFTNAQNATQVQSSSGPQNQAERGLLSKENKGDADTNSIQVQLTSVESVDHEDYFLPRDNKNRSASFTPLSTVKKDEEAIAQRPRSHTLANDKDISLYREQKDRLIKQLMREYSIEDQHMQSLGKKFENAPMAVFGTNIKSKASTSTTANSFNISEKIKDNDFLIAMGFISR